MIWSESLSQSASQEILGSTIPLEIERNSEHIICSRKEYEVVESIEYKGYNEIEVYNLIVENYHTFFITELGLMVHNIDCKNATLGQIFKQFR